MRPELFDGADELEWISYGGELQEAVVWFGLEGSPSSPPRRRATALPGPN
ncbi:hypothetical protein AB0K51_18330 [Kitasatospora sp. NPDC049285]